LYCSELTFFGVKRTSTLVSRTSIVGAADSGLVVAIDASFVWMLLTEPTINRTPRTAFACRARSLSQNAAITV
jgi:hypothetical protein